MNTSKVKYSEGTLGLLMMIPSIVAIITVTYMEISKQNDSATCNHSSVNSVIHVEKQGICGMGSTK